MAGESVKCEAICLDIRPWSRTSHIVSWLTPNGKVVTVVKGAVRAKSFFLGQYDLNYTCEIVYYSRAKGEVHALRECVPVRMRETLRTDYRKLAIAGYFRRLVAELAPMGEECRAWYELLEHSLSNFTAQISDFIQFELKVLELSGLKPDFSRVDWGSAQWLPLSLETGVLGSNEGRSIRVSREVADYLAGGAKVAKNPTTPLDAARVIGVFYQFHLDCAVEVRRTVLMLALEK